MAVRLQLLSLFEGPHIALDKPIMLFGRHPECDVQLQSKKISRKHCVLALHGDEVLLRDLESTNGVCVNGAKVVTGSAKPGDEVTIGTFRYKLATTEADDSGDATIKGES